MTIARALAAATAALEGLIARLVTANAGAAPLVRAVVPSAAHPASLRCAPEFSVHGGEHEGLRKASAGAELSGVLVAESGISCTTGEAAAAATYLIAGV